MGDLPQTIELARHRDLAGRERHPWVRRVLLALVALPLVLALLNVFGQRQETLAATAPAARLTVNAPPRVRGGLLFTIWFDVEARQELKDAQLVLDPGWIDGMQVNSTNPQPLGEASRDGRIVLDLGHVPAGQSYRAFLELQVDPTTVGRRRQDVELDDGSQRILVLHHTMTVFP
ncbi:MAG: hypothetical protein QOE29_318 [Gaiellaceae bacterium]|jgi:hypothetical protein|nr:hypothetical protein [Gaiellaceae bacterium]